MELVHFTTARAAALIDNHDGTVTLATPARGWVWRVPQAAQMIWSRQPAVYFYAGRPSWIERHFHHDTVPEAVVTVAGVDLLDRHPGVVYRSLWGHALAVPGGYTGPGTITPVRSWGR